MARWRLAACGAVAVAAFAYAAAVLFSVPGHMAAGDSLYHFVVAREIWHGDLAPSPARSFPWTVFREWDVDHYWGFHLLVSPFAAFADPETGMKLAAAFFFAALLTTITVVMVRRRVPLPWAWAIGTILFSSQDWRYLQLRGGALMAALALVLIEVACFVERARRRRALVVVLAMLAVLSYHGAFVLLPLHVVAVAALALEKDRATFRERAFEPLLTVLGLALGLVVNPYMDRRASTFAFAWFHVRNMAGDSAGLFAGQTNVEFNPFPIALLGSEWGWIVLLAAVIAALAVVARRRWSGARVASRDELVYGALTVAGVVLTARAVRMREYAVPIAFVFFGAVARPWVAQALRAPRLVRAAPLATSAALLLLAGRQWSKSVERIPRVHPPIGLYADARPLLERSAGVPVANLTEGDANMLLWEWDRVEVAHALSPYFIYFRDRELWQDLRSLRTSSADDVAVPALARLRDRGCRLVSARRETAFGAFAARHPELVRIVYTNPIYDSRLYEIER